MKIFGLKESTATKYIKKRLKSLENSEKKSLRIVQSVGILADAKLFEAYDFTKKLSEYLNIPTEKFKLILYQDSDRIPETEQSVHEIFSENDFKMNGKIKSGSVKNFAGTDFDLLINYCDFDNVFANVLVLRSEATLKAGFDNMETPFYNISIKTNKNKIHAFNEELARYLQILKLIAEPNP